MRCVFCADSAEACGEHYRTSERGEVPEVQAHECDYQEDTRRSEGHA